MNRVRLAVIGVGALGQHHARILSTMEDVQLVGVVDAREQQGREIARKHGTQWYANASDVMSLVDGAVIAVPTVAHLDVTRPFLEAGKAVLVEKPLAHSLDAARTLQRLASFRRGLLQVGHVERFNPAFQLLKQECGQPLYIRCQRVSPFTFRSTDIGVVHDLMIHDIDLVLSLTGDSIDEVSSFGAVTIGPHEDMATARLRTRRGVFIDLTSSRMNPVGERSIQVWSSEGFASADLQSRKVTTWKPCAAIAANPGMVHDIVSATPNPLTLKDEVFTKWMKKEEHQASSADALTSELRDFVECIRHQGVPQVPGEAAVAAMEVADRVLNGMSLWSWQSGQKKENSRHAA